MTKFGLSLKASKLGLLAASLAFVLSGCSIEDIASEEIKLQSDSVIESNLNSSDPTVRFIAEAEKCVQGDISNLQQLIQTYYSTFTNSTNYSPTQFMYQRVEPTLAFEKCAEKAQAMGDNSAMSQVIIRPARIARISRYFYIQKEYAQGAFWLQRLVNMNGEKDGLYVAGRVFIQDIRTINIGVRLLEQSARLENREARQMLLGLLQPGSSYYQSITRNALLEEERNANGSDSIQSGTTDTNPDLITDQGQAAALEMAEERLKSQADQDFRAQSGDEQTAAAARSSTGREATDLQNPAATAAAQKASTATPARANTSTQTTDTANATDEADYSTVTTVPAIKRKEHAERIKDVQAKADAAAAAAEQHTKAAPDDNAD